MHSSGPLESERPRWDSDPAARTSGGSIPDPTAGPRRAPYPAPCAPTHCARRHAPRPAPYTPPRAPRVAPHRLQHGPMTRRSLMTPRPPPELSRARIDRARQTTHSRGSDIPRGSLDSAERTPAQSFYWSRRCMSTRTGEGCVWAIWETPRPRPGLSPLPLDRVRRTPSNGSVCR